VKALLSLTLIVAQLLSWSATPIYLCWGCELSVCVHASLACHCCQQVEIPAGESDLVCCPHHSQLEDAESRAWRVERLAAAPACDCIHLLLSLPSQPVVAKSAVAPDDSRPDFGAVVPYVLSSAWLTASARRGHSLLAGLYPHLAQSSIGLSTLMLRC